MSRPLIIAIDGPSGSGKSTLGRLLARELGLLYIDTGSIYRAVALAVIETTLNAADDVAVSALVERADIDLAGDPDSLKVKLDGREIVGAQPQSFDPWDFSMSEQPSPAR